MGTVEEAFQKAVKAMNSGKPLEAERLFKNVLKRLPNNIAVLNLLTVVLVSMERHAEAEAFISKAIKLNQSSDVSYCNYGLISKRLGKPQQALEQFNRAIRLNAQAPETWNNRGTVFNDLKQYEDAIRDFNQAIALASNYPEALCNKGKSLGFLKRYDEAFAAYDEALSLNPGLAEAWLGRGNAFTELRRYDEALAAYDKSLALKPGLAEAWLARGNIFTALKRHDEAFAAYEKALALKADLAEAWLGRGNIFAELRRYDEAFAAYDKALALKPDLEGAWLGRGNVFTELKRYDDALAAYDKALALKADLAEVWLGLGNLFFELRRYDEALAAYDKALVLRPDSEGAWLGRGNVFTELKRYDDALAAYDKALALKADSAEAWLGLGNVFVELRRYDEALAAYDKALARRPGLAESWLGRGNVFYELRRYDEALAAYDKALALKPGSAEAWLGRGNIFNELRRYDEALAAYDKALARRPGLAESWFGRGNVCYGLRRYDEALAAYDKALALKPGLAEAWLGRGNTFNELRRYDEAFAAYDKAMALKPELVGAEGSRLHSKMQVCNWEGFESDCNHLIGSVRNNKKNTDPFAFLSINSSVEDQYNCASMWVSKQHPPANQPLWNGEIYKHDKIRIGYVSADLREHPVGYLIAGVFECCNRSQFELTAISIGPNDNSEMRQRLEGCFDNFVDAAADLNPDDIAKKIREAEIDIVVDLNGFTQNARTAIFARRPAPIQVNYLGYPGTMGAGYIDYIIGDPIVIPRSQQGSYREKVVYLPPSYMPHDDRGRIISDRAFARREFGLPEQGFVFCCFNNAYKLNPDIFRLWMRLLKAVDASVLWLSENSGTAADNLRKEAVGAGVNPERIVFAKRLPSSADHLARHRLADLFLDTLPYNAHTTASDALWAGLPVLTQIGNTFAGRVAASLLNAINLPGLITETPEEYERLAIDLAMHPEKLAAIKHKLTENRLTSPLFDTRLFTKHIESAYIAMYERHQAGLAPVHIVIPN
jgi:protein O-GlcNAc transferase